MCDIGAAALAVSTLGGLYAAGEQSAIGAQNSQLARAEAAQQEEIGRYEEQKTRSRMDRLIKQQRGQFAARGVRLDSASAQRLGAEASLERSKEAEAIRFNTGSQVDASNAEADLAERRGRLGFITGVTNTGARTVSSSLKLWPELAGG
jgi:hypothetical protein